MAKATSQQYAAARILTGEWLASLTHSIESRRSKARALTAFVDSEKLALITAHVVTRPRKDDEAPSPLTVAEEIGELLGAKDRIAMRAGAALLGMAHSCGFIDITDGKRRAGWQAANEIRLSIMAEAQRAEIEARLAASEIAPARPMLQAPPVQIKITKNKDGLEAAPLPIGWAVAEALAPIQATAWRVNQFMLKTLRKLKKTQADKAAFAQALQYADAPEFFYRCNFDWRGRLYQQGGRLQYTSGTDAARALLEFAHGERLSEDGYTWLAVHVATCFGIRGSFPDRAVWTHKFERRITEAVADPIGSDWWRRRAKHPYRFLAACHAWVNRAAPVHLPITADGTASGWQHFALLLRDEELGRRLNLAPCALNDTPRDFYAEIAKHTPYTRKEIKGEWLLYGSKPERGPGAARQRGIHKLLKAQGPRAWKLYLALARAAKQAGKAGRALEWTLPDGFQVLQADRVQNTRKVELWLHGKHGPWRLQARQRVLLEALDINAQARGLPPNLIHSLDACLLRAIVREAPSVSRWAVAHDCIGVHPNDGGRLRMAIVEAIECLYGPDVLASLGAWCDGIPDHPAALPATMRGGWYTFS